MEVGTHGSIPSHPVQQVQLLISYMLHKALKVEEGKYLRERNIPFCLIKVPPHSLYELRLSVRGLLHNIHPDQKRGHQLIQLVNLLPLQCALSLQLKVFSLLLGHLSFKRAVSYL